VTKTEIVVRRTQILVEEKRVEIGRDLTRPIRRVVAAAVLTNPFAHQVARLGAGRESRRPTRWP